MEQHLAKTDTESRDMIIALSGVALVIFGAGLIMSHPFIRKHLGNSGLGVFASAIPDFERYMKLRSM
jgi:hypothetical protein